MLWLLAAMASAQASSPLLEPTGSWTLSSQDDGCTVERAFDDSRPIFLGFQTMMQSRPAFLLVRGPKKYLPQGIGELPLKLDGSEPVMVRYGSFETGDPSDRLLKLFPDEATMTRISAANRVEIGTKMPPFHITNTSAAIKAVDDCISKKITSWGVDPTLYFEGKTASITGNFASLFDAQSYPKEARGRGASGRVLLLLKTDENGAVSDCKVLETPDQSLNAGTCEVAKRGRLKPPLGSADHAIASYAVIPVTWTHP